jgi:alkylation response protein AidB-like acyl-CoA dehydrogenase
MMDHLLTDAQKAWRDEVRDFVKSVPRQMIIDMDADKIKFPKEFLQEAARRNLLGCRYPKKWGGREMDWVSTCVAMEEVGTLGYIFACVFGVGAELVCDAIVIHGTDEQKNATLSRFFEGNSSLLNALPNPAVDLTSLAPQLTP